MAPFETLDHFPLVKAQVRKQPSDIDAVAANAGIDGELLAFSMATSRAPSGHNNHDLDDNLKA